MSNKPKAYFARSVVQFGNHQDKQDIQMIERLGFEVVDPSTKETQLHYRAYGMTIFMEMVDSCDVLFFRAFPDGSIPAGVGKEIDRAKWRARIPVLELPNGILRRGLNVEETREYLRELGRLA